MSRTSSDEQLNFLLKCVKHSNNGKVDFAAVANECDIVTKGAAAKRYERMMKAHGINPNGGSASGQSPPESPSPAKNSPAAKGGKGTPSKKRKATNSTTTPSKKGKFQPDPETENESQPPVKVEGENGDGQIPGGGMYKSATNPDPMISGTAAEAAEQDAAALFSQFCHSIDSEAETSAKKGRLGTKRGAAVAKQEGTETEGEDNDPILKEEPEVIG